MKDFTEMNDGELLEELVQRVIDWERALEDIHAWDMTRTYTGIEDEQDALAREDEAFCRVREIVRHVRNDETIWTC